MANKSRLDQTTITQMTFDEDLQANRVHIVDMETQIELSADDGDSVLLRQDSSMMKASNGDSLDMSKVSKVMLMGKAELASLVQMDGEFEVGEITLLKDKVKEIVMTNVKVKVDEAFADAVIYLMVK